MSSKSQFDVNLNRALGWLHSPMTKVQLFGVERLGVANRVPVEAFMRAVGLSPKIIDSYDQVSDPNQADATNPLAKDQSPPFDGAIAGIQRGSLGYSQIEEDFRHDYLIPKGLTDPLKEWKTARLGQVLNQPFIIKWLKDNDHPEALHRIGGTDSKPEYGLAILGQWFIENDKHDIVRNLDNKYHIQEYFFGPIQPGQKFAVIPEFFRAVQDLDKEAGINYSLLAKTDLNPDEIRHWHLAKPGSTKLGTLLNDPLIKDWLTRNRYQNVLDRLDQLGSNPVDQNEYLGRWFLNNHPQIIPALKSANDLQALLEAGTPAARNEPSIELKALHQKTSSWDAEGAEDLKNNRPPFPNLRSPKALGLTELILATARLDSRLWRCLRAGIKGLNSRGREGTGKQAFWRGLASECADITYERAVDEDRKAGRPPPDKEYETDERTGKKTYHYRNLARNVSDYLTTVLSNHWVGAANDLWRVTPDADWQEKIGGLVNFAAQNADPFLKAKAAAMRSAARKDLEDGKIDKGDPTQTVYKKLNKQAAGIEFYGETFSLIGRLARTWYVKFDRDAPGPWRPITLAKAFIYTVESAYAFIQKVPLDSDFRKANEHVFKYFMPQRNTDAKGNDVPVSVLDSLTAFFSVSLRAYSEGQFLDRIHKSNAAESENRVYVNEYYSSELLSGVLALFLNERSRRNIRLAAQKSGPFAMGLVDTLEHVIEKHTPRREYYDAVKSLNNILEGPQLQGILDKALELLKDPSLQSPTTQEELATAVKIATSLKERRDLTEWQNVDQVDALAVEMKECLKKAENLGVVPGLADGESLISGLRQNVQKVRNLEMNHPKSRMKRGGPFLVEALFATIDYCVQTSAKNKGLDGTKKMQDIHTFTETLAEHPPFRGAFEQFFIDQDSGTAKEVVQASAVGLVLSGIHAFFPNAEWLQTLATNATVEAMARNNSADSGSPLATGGHVAT